MSAHFLLAHSPLAISKALGLSVAPEPRPRIEIDRGDRVPVLEVRYSQTRKSTEAQWGVPVPWESPFFEHMFYVRSEDIGRKQYLGLLQDFCTCIVPSSAIIATHNPKPNTTPRCVCRADRDIMRYAGVMCSWVSPRSIITHGCLILTQAANQFLLPDNNRMPFILDDNEADRWLEYDLLKSENIYCDFTPFSSRGLESVLIEGDPLSMFHADFGTFVASAIPGAAQWSNQIV